MLTKPLAQKMICKAINANANIRATSINNIGHIDRLIDGIVRKHNLRNGNGVETNGDDRVFYVDISRIAQLYCSTVKRRRAENS